MLATFLDWLSTVAVLILGGDPEDWFWKALRGRRGAQR